MTHRTGRVLLVEEDQSTREKIKAMLEERGHEVTVFGTCEEGWDAYCAANFPLVVTGWSMSGMSGGEFCGRIRLREKSRYTMIAVLIDKGDEEEMLSAFEAGIDDLIIKPITPMEFNLRMVVIENRLKKRIRRELEKETQIKAKATMQQQALSDPLTGVCNRRHILDLASREMSRCRRFGRPLSLLLIDCDRLEEINREYGQDAGDEALRHASRACSGNSRSYDFIGRTGSDKFMVILPETTLEEAYVVALRITTAIRNEPVKFGSSQFHISASCGTGEVRKEDIDFWAALNRAEQSLKHAKGNR